MADKKPKKSPTQKLSEAKLAKNVDYMVMNKEDLIKAIQTLQTEVKMFKKGTVTKEVVNVHAYNTRRKELARALTAQSNKLREDQ